MALLVVIGGIVASSLFSLDTRGVRLLGDLPRGLPGLSLPAIDWADLNELLPLALACFMLGAVESAAIGRMFAAKHGGRLDANQEFLALAASNLLAGLGRGYPVSGGMSQSLVNEGSGARTPLSGAVAAGVVLLVTVFLSHLLRALPQPVLAAIVLVAVTGLFKVSTLRHLRRTNRTEYIVAVAALVGVLTSGLLRGVLIGAIISLVLLIRRASRPHVAVLGRIPGTRRFSDHERWQDIFSVTKRGFVGEILPIDDNISPDGRVMEILSEHQCQGWLEGYLLTGRHGFFNCYEAFIHIIDSMFNQHAKWLKVCNHIPWRRPIASLNYLLSSHVWRQDHNGFSHQDPGFIDHVVNKKAEIIRVYLPPDANCLLHVTDRCLRSRNLVNVIVAGKQPAPQWLNMDQAIKHCEAGIGIWEWASNDKGGEPDVVMACCGDVPTLETLAAVDLLRRHIPEIKVRVINVVDLMTLQPEREHPHGLSDHDFDVLFTKDRPIVFAFHGYPWLIHRLTYRRNNHRNLHVRGYKEEGTTTTPFDMCVLNDLDRFHLVGDVIDRVPSLGSRAAYAKQAIRDALIEHKQYITRRGEDDPRILGWKWGGGGARSGVRSSTEGDNI
jgi:hypothetical protein